jgi:hypothetical protein
LHTYTHIHVHGIKFLLIAIYLLEMYKKRDVTYICMIMKSHLLSNEL